MLHAFSTLLDFIFPLRSDERLVREAEDGDLLAQYRPRAIGDTTALLPFRVPLVRAMIHEAKYRDNPKAQRHLASMLAAYLKEIKEDAVLIPIPLSAARMKSRGFNQCERIAKLSGAKTDTELLVRTRDTGQQVKLSRTERLTNVKDAFSARNADPNALYIVLDDVITTGSTMQAAVDALKAAGVKRISPVALAS